MCLTGLRSKCQQGSLHSFRRAKGESTSLPFLPSRGCPNSWVQASLLHLQSQPHWPVSPLTCPVSLLLQPPHPRTIHRLPLPTIIVLIGKAAFYKQLFFLACSILRSPDNCFTSFPLWCSWNILYIPIENNNSSYFLPALLQDKRNTRLCVHKRT